MTTRVLHEDERYRVTLFRGSGDGSRLVVGFEHGHSQMRGGLTPARYPNYAARVGVVAVAGASPGRGPDNIGPGS